MFPPEEKTDDKQPNVTEEFGSKVKLEFKKRLKYI